MRIIKPRILEMMCRDFPEFQFVGSPSIFYVFRRKSSGELFDYVKYQRDGQSGALAVDVATTYDANWDLCTLRQVGWDCPLQVYMKRGLQNSFTFNWEEPWYNYGNDEDKFRAVLTAISRDLAKYGPRFFGEATRLLESDRLLQYGLSIIRKWGPLSEVEIATLHDDIKAADYLTVDVRNSRLDRLKAMLQSFAMVANFAEATELDIAALAIKLLFLQSDKQKA